jgi:hypothetical protein
MVVTAASDVKALHAFVRRSIHASIVHSALQGAERRRWKFLIKPVTTYPTLAISSEVLFQQGQLRSADTRRGSPRRDRNPGTQ